MEKVKVAMTVLFEEPFWIGIYEREDGESYQAAKILFGAEPKGAGSAGISAEKCVSAFFWHW